MNIKVIRRAAGVACLLVAAGAVYLMPAEGSFRLPQLAWCGLALLAVLAAVLLFVFDAADGDPHAPAEVSQSGPLEAQYSDLPAWVDDAKNLDAREALDISELPFPP